MSRRLLVVEPDTITRTLMERVLTSDGYTAEDFESVHHARLLLDDDAFDLAVVDEMAGSKGVLEEVVFLRERYPRLPVVVTGTLLSQPTLLSLLRLGGSTEALSKPFTPTQLRDAVARTLARAMPGHMASVEFAAALRAARNELADGNLERTRAALARVHAEAPLDAEGMALEAMYAELEGRDGDAQRGYRAAIALRDDEATASPDAYEGLARIAAYGKARPTASLSPRFASANIWLVVDPVHELDRPPVEPDTPIVVVTSLAISPDAPSLFYREAPTRAFVLVGATLRVERLAPVLAKLSRGGILESPHPDSLDFERLRALHAQFVETARPAEPSATR